MNECEKYRELISSLIDSEISEEDKSALAKHLEVCPGCRALYDSFKAVSDLISDELEDVPEGLHENIMAQIRRDDIKKKNKRKISKPFKAFIATAACAAVFVGLGFGLNSVSRPAESPATFAMPPQGNESNAAPMEASLPRSADISESEAASEEKIMQVSEADGSETAEENGISSADIKRGQLFSESSVPRLGMQAPAAEVLSEERFEALLDLADGNSADDEAEAVRASELILGLSCEDGRAVDFYDYNSILYYIVSSSESVYTAGCEYSDILDFLNQNN